MVKQADWSSLMHKLFQAYPTMCHTRLLDGLTLLGAIGLVIGVLLLIWSFFVRTVFDIESKNDRKWFNVKFYGGMIATILGAIMMFGSHTICVHNKANYDESLRQEVRTMIPADAKGTVVTAGEETLLYNGDVTHQSQLKQAPLEVINNGVYVANPGKIDVKPDTTQVINLRQVALTRCQGMYHGLKTSDFDEDGAESELLTSLNQEGDILLAKQNFGLSKGQHVAFRW